MKRNRSFSRPLRRNALCAALALALPAAAEAAVAGRVQFVAGDVRVVDAAGREQRAAKGQDINEGDTVVSAAASSAQLRMVDGAIIAVRPGTQLKIAGYVYNGKDDGTESAALSLVKGGLRAITGVIGKQRRERYRMDTPTATIGIRGTDYEPVVVLAPAAGETPGAPPGTYDKVNVGATSLATRAGTTVVAANQVGYAASPTQVPVLLPSLPDFYRATPTPHSRQGGKPDQEAKLDQRQDQKQEQEQEQKQDQKQEQERKTASFEQSSISSSAQSDTVPAATAPTLTGADTSGTTLNLAHQTLTSASGQTASLTDTVPVTGGSAGDGTGGTATLHVTPGAGLMAIYPESQTTQAGVGYFPKFYAFDGAPDGILRDASGNVTGVTGSSDASFGYQQSIAQSGSTLTDTGKDAATGLSWGRWRGGQVTVTSQYAGVDATGKFGYGAADASGNFVIGATQVDTTALGQNSLHWIAGTDASPSYLPSVLSGTATYTMVGGTHPTDSQGNVGTLTSANLSANFTSQTVNAGVNFTMGTNTWSLQSNNMLLLGDARFNSYAFCTSSNCNTGVIIVKNGVTLGSTPATTGSFATANFVGSFTGIGLSGAGLMYAVVDNSISGTAVTESLIQGAVAFSGPTQDVNTPFRAAVSFDGWGNDKLFSGDNLYALAQAGTFRGSIDGGLDPVSRVIDTGGALTEFAGSVRGYTPVIGSANSTLYYDDTPATVKIGTAVNRDLGTATVGTVTVHWGRWEGGTVDIYSRDGATKIGTIDNSSRSVHWLTTSQLTSQTFALPLTGTATYSLAGNTSPTDLHGNVGKVTSAMLNADFTNAKVDAGVTVGFDPATNAGTWTMNATGIPLGGSGDFKSTTMQSGTSGITHTASCSGGACGAQTIGAIDGHFIAGAQGAVIFYSMATGSASTPTNTTSTSSASATSKLPIFTPSNLVSGLLVMKR